MDLMQAIRERHSVRAYQEKPIDADTVEKLRTKIAQLNAESGLNMQLVVDEPKAFSGFFVHYGKFHGVRNYVVVAGKKDADEMCGYYGEKLVLEAQMLGLNSCWVGLTYKKVKGEYTLREDEKVHLVIALGYGLTQGVAHKIKSYDDVVGEKDNGDAPEWFVRGVEAALLAPTAINQQKFMFTLKGDKVAATTKWGFFSKVDLGIAKLHFEIGSGKDSTVWL